MAGSGGPSSQPYPPSSYGNGGNDAYGYTAPIPLGGAGGLKRDREESNAMPPPQAGTAAQGDAPRKRRSRWGEEKTDLGVTTALGANVSESEVEKYAINVRIEEITRKLRSGEVVPPERERSPSPPPTYDAQGRRTNTREVRYRKKLEDERVRLVDKQIKFDPNYKPPVEYAAAKKNMKPTEKVFLPIKEFPEINFFGLIVGPRGNSLKKMERDSGAKISIRGKGSVKDGKGRGGEEDQEEMHCVITADDEESVRRCIRLINQVIETAASTPEAQNDHKRNQLRELAALNGTLRDDENQICQNCGQKGHRKYECPEQRNWTTNIVCHRCGNQGHLARDCTQGRGMPYNGANMAGPPGAPAPGDPFNSEYENLMAELGQGNRGGGPGGPAARAGPLPGGYNGPGVGAPGGAMDRPVGPDGKKIPPWRDPNIWNTPSFGGGPPRGPRMGMGYGGSHQQAQYMQGGNYQPHRQQHQQPWNGGAQPQGGYPDYNQQQPAAEANGQTDGSQPDYRQAWEEYYRQQGMDPAAAAAAASAGATGVDASAAQPSNEQPQQDYSKEWEEYYRQQAAAAGAPAGGQH